MSYLSSRGHSRNASALLQAERMTQSEVASLLRTAVYIVVGIPIPAGAAAAVFFLPHSRSVHQPFAGSANTHCPWACGSGRCCKFSHAICLWKCSFPPVALQSLFLLILSHQLEIRVLNVQEV